MRLIDVQRFRSVLSRATCFREQSARHGFLVTQGHAGERRRARSCLDAFLGGMCPCARTPTPACGGTSRARCFQLWGKRLLMGQGCLRAKVSNSIPPSVPSSLPTPLVSSVASEHGQRHDLISTTNTPMRRIKPLVAKF